MTPKKHKKAVKPKCDRCKHYDCYEGKDCFGLQEEIKTQYQEDPVLKKISKAAAKVEAKFYGIATRLEEIAHFAREAGFKHLGVAYCGGFKEEARIVCDMLRALFKVSSVCCKTCSVPKSDLGFPPVRPNEEESICNPLAQARLLNQAGTELNIAMGLCVGHDSIFNRESKALVTTFVAKDRVLAHNPVGAVYCSYVNKRLKEGLFAK
jgi:uncharacterized metal-binding protein